MFFGCENISSRAHSRRLCSGMDLRCLACGLVLFSAMLACVVLSIPEVIQDFQPKELFYSAEILATLLFAAMGAVTSASASGRLSGFSRKFLFIGFATFVTATGGGTIRDLLSEVSPFWIRDPRCIIWPIAVSFVIAASRIVSWGHAKGVISVLNGICTGIFTWLGVIKAQQLVGENSPGFMIIGIVLALMTGLGGGILRDTVILRRRPDGLAKDFFLSCLIVAAIQVMAMKLGLMTVSASGLEIPVWAITTACMPCLNLILRSLLAEDARERKSFRPLLATGRRPAGVQDHMVFRAGQNGDLISQRARGFSIKMPVTQPREATGAKLALTAESCKWIRRKEPANRAAF